MSPGVAALKPESAESLWPNCGTCHHEDPFRPQSQGLLTISYLLQDKRGPFANIVPAFNTKPGVDIGSRHRLRLHREQT